MLWGPIVHCGTKSCNELTVIFGQDPILNQTWLTTPKVFETQFTLYNIIGEGCGNTCLWLVFTRYLSQTVTHDSITKNMVRFLFLKCDVFQFHYLIQILFSFVLGIVMYDNGFEEKENKIWTKYKIELQHVRIIWFWWMLKISKTCVIFVKRNLMTILTFQ